MIETWVRLLSNRWTRIVRLVAIETFMILGIIGAATDVHHTGPIDALGVGLMVAATGMWYYADRWRTGTLVVTLAATELYFARGYNTSSPWFFPIVLLTYMATVWDSPLRSIVIVAVNSALTAA